jgi:hypothetical protein
MTRSNRLLIGAGVAAALVLALVYFASPILALKGLTDAAKAGNRDELAQRVDFPAVRESLKIQLKAVMTRSFAQDPALRDNPFAALGQMLMVGVVDKAVDAYATPDAIAAMVAESRPPKEISTTAPPPAPQTAGPETAAPAQPAPDKTKMETRYAYQGLNHFRVSYHEPGKPEDSDFRLILERQGFFKWKLVRIELPRALGQP